MKIIHLTHELKAKRILPSMIIAATCFAATPAQAAFIDNGSFESPNISPATVMNINAGSEPATFLWQVTAGNVDIVGNGFAGSTASAYHGTQVLDLVGTGSIGGVSLLLPTTAGTQYRLSFAYANNPFNGQTTASATVSLLDNTNPIFSESITHDTSSTINFDWAIFDRVFTGTGGPVRLAFENTVAIAGNDGGILLDAISLSPVPIPAAFWLFGTGLAAISLGRRHRITRQGSSATAGVNECNSRA